MSDYTAEDGSLMITIKCNRHQLPEIMEKITDNELVVWQVKTIDYGDPGRLNITSIITSALSHDFDTNKLTDEIENVGENVTLTVGPWHDKWRNKNKFTGGTSAGIAGPFTLSVCKKEPSKFEKLFRKIGFKGED